MYCISFQNSKKPTKKTLSLDSFSPSLQLAPIHKCTLKRRKWGRGEKRKKNNNNNKKRANTQLTPIKMGKLSILLTYLRHTEHGSRSPKLVQMTKCEAC